MKNTIHELTSLGQSLWYDNIQRRLLQNGELAALIANGDVRGVTSNPSIFHNAIAKSHDYDAALTPLAIAGWDAEQIFWQLATEDIRAACDLFLPLYNETHGKDGFVSIEVSPYLADQTDATIAQAKHLWDTLARPNLMIKIPATKAGIPAIRASIAAGINVNVTLIFSLERYGEVMEAYLSGLEDRLKAGEEIGKIASVASFFVSRVDTKIDPRLPEGSALRGKAAIANAKLAYEQFSNVFSSKRFEMLKLSLAHVQRPLWASTGVKNPAYPDTLYVDELIGPDTVNTVPPATLDAFRDHGKAAVTVVDGIEECQQQLAELEKLGISMSAVTGELEVEGVKAFVDAFTALLQTVNERRKAVVDQLGPLAVPVAQCVNRLEITHVVQRMNAIDPTLWTDDPAGQKEIKIRLGWLGLPETSRAAVPEINDFAAQIRAAGLTHTLLIGMGGSSLAPEVLSLVFADVCPAARNFAILDSTDPAQVLAAAEAFPVEKTVFIVSSKSGGTSEVTANFNYFWAKAEKAFGKKAGEHFVAITDPGTGLEKLARERGFGKIFNADPMVGGRYSALTHFGLVPAALMGIDIEKLLARAADMAQECAVFGDRNPGLVLGAVMGQAALSGRDKLTIIADPALASVGSWLEQLIAESTGKLGKGVVPVDLEPLDVASVYGKDRLFVYLRKDGAFDAALADLQKSGQPLLVFNVADPYDLGAELYRWEVATAVACAVLNVNPFDQPDVQDAKDRTKAKIAEYRKEGKLPEGFPVTLENAKATLTEFLAKAEPGDYVAINAYLPRNPVIAEGLTALRTIIRARTGCATTVGFGPRFLHSTGQLHKGGADNGLFLQITADAVADVDIPTENMTYGVLERAQSLGDFEALIARQRRALRIHLPNPAALRQLVDILK
ncbi:MAG: bifunctional transaldolase/phosoglucose isomerase [Anaerolineales bacterium]